MKICTVCNEKYYDDDLNYCLSDGGLLTKDPDDPPPTVMMNQARTTNQGNNRSWANPTGWNAPQQPPPGPVSPWQQNQQMPQNMNPGYMAPQMYRSQNQVLPIISMVLGIISMFFCCYGCPFGLAAAITGFLGMNNANKNPVEYGGRGFAIAGLVLGILNLIITIVIVIIIVIGSAK